MHRQIQENPCKFPAEQGKWPRIQQSMVRPGLATPPKQKKPHNGAFLFWERVWVFEPCSTNRLKPVGEAALERYRASEMLILVCLTWR